MKSFYNAMSIIPVTLSFLFLFFIYNFDVVFAAPTSHLCRPEQRDALLEFKNEFEIGIPEYSYLRASSHPKTKSWTNNIDCCNWEGITCNSKSGEVIELNLRRSCLQGQFHSNSSLQNLHFLTTLVLSSNAFRGQIPSFIGNLSHLTTLSLFINHFSGQIPSSIGNLSQLIFLSLSYNDFSGQIPSWIENLSQLTSLELSGNQFSGQIPSWIGNLSQLHFLDLSDNNFTGEVPSSLGNLNQLYVFGVGSNKLSGKFPIVLLDLTELSWLSLRENLFTGTLPPNFTSLSKLTHFDASDNGFTGALPSSLFTFPSLEIAQLDNNQSNDTLEFGNISSPPCNLEYLDLGNNNFRGPVPSSISKLTNLRGLDLSYLNTQGRVDFSIFSHLKSLEELYLSHLNTTTTINLDDILSCFKNLSSLDLSGNQVSSTNKSFVSHLPLESMRDLSLSGCGITEFPEFLRNQQFMMTLDISNNKINGQVPGWLWTQLPDLYDVNLSNNTFTGFENSTKAGLSSITALFGSNNNFTGNIPSFICALRSLRVLDLSNNNFNGSIPHCLGNLKFNLSVLNLRRNHLGGSLPHNVFERLRSLDVGHNQLIGKLPRSLIHFSNLEVLNIENNLINDTFPFWLSYLQKLQVLVLRSNAFHGPIHHASFPKLQIIDISHNLFNGTFPSDYFVKWSAMSSLETNEEYESDGKYMGDRYYHDSMVLMNKGREMELTLILKIYTALDFSGNKFEGKIPKSIGVLKELHVLNLSNNAFTGHIPSSMENLTALESLDVFHNQLSGAIPQELGNLSFLSYMNFSHNHLTGLVPGGTQFRTQKCSSFEDNLGLLGLPLDCGDIHTLRSHERQESEEEQEEVVISWIAAVIGFIPGIALGLTIGYILSCYRPHWFMQPFGRINR